MGQTILSHLIALIKLNQFLQPVMTLTKPAGDANIQINTSALSTGTYIVKINTTLGYRTVRLLVQ